MASVLLGGTAGIEGLGLGGGGAGGERSEQFEEAIKALETYKKKDTSKGVYRGRLNRGPGFWMRRERSFRSFVRGALTNTCACAYPFSAYYETYR